MLAGQNVLFTDAPVKCGRGYVVHREGAGLVTLRGICNGCSPIARYRVLFVGNISVPTGGTAGAISVALALGGEALPTTTATATPAAVGDAFNVAIGIVWQCSLTIIPMYLVVRQQLGLWSSIALLLVTTLILRKTWYKPLCKEEISYNEEIKQLKQEKE